MKCCENCNSILLVTFASGRFCNLKCARSFSTKNIERFTKIIEPRIAEPRIVPSRNCPLCDEIISYKRINKYTLACKKNLLCQKCSTKKTNNTKLEILLTRECPSCSKQLVYDRKLSYERAFINNRKCRSCSKSVKRSDYTIPNATKGHGICGNYKGFHFRSSLELHYIINILERFDISWTSAEKLPGIEYTIDGKKRKYKADFLISNKYLVEIKPKNLRNSSINLLKKEAAQTFCMLNSLKYKVTESGCYSVKEMFDMHQAGIITLPTIYVNKLLRKYSINP